MGKNSRNGPNAWSSARMCHFSMPSTGHPQVTHRSPLCVAGSHLGMLPMRCPAEPKHWCSGRIFSAGAVGTQARSQPGGSHCGHASLLQGYDEADCRRLSPSLKIGLFDGNQGGGWSFPRITAAGLRGMVRCDLLTILCETIAIDHCWDPYLSNQDA